MAGYENLAFQHHPETKCWFLNADIKSQKQGHERQGGGAGKQAGVTLKGWSHSDTKGMIKQYKLFPQNLQPTKHSILFKF